MRIRIRCKHCFRCKMRNDPNNPRVFIRRIGNKRVATQKVTSLPRASLAKY